MNVELAVSPAFLKMAQAIGSVVFDSVEVDIAEVISHFAGYDGDRTLDYRGLTMLYSGNEEMEPIRSIEGFLRDGLDESEMSARCYVAANELDKMLGSSHEIEATDIYEFLCIVRAALYHEQRAYDGKLEYGLATVGESSLIMKNSIDYQLNGVSFNLFELIDFSSAESLDEIALNSAPETVKKSLLQEAIENEFEVDHNGVLSYIERTLSDGNVGGMVIDSGIQMLSERSEFKIPDIFAEHQDLVKRAMLNAESHLSSIRAI